MSDKCPICNNLVPEFQPLRDNVECRTCGTYRPTERFLSDIHPASLAQDQNIEPRYLLSGVVREKAETGIVPTLHSLDELQAQIPFRDDPLASIDRILLYVYRKAESSANYVHLDVKTDYPVGYGRDHKEFEFFVEKAVELDYLEAVVPEIWSFANFRLSLKGWERVGNLRHQQIDSRQAFVAMWFNEDMNTAFSEGFIPALEATGYQPFRVDMREHNGKIDDLIIAEIRKSGLLIADFTGQRGGVYFEAGFAMGLGIPVIWTCRRDDLKNLHFDTRQYNHIDWTNTAELKEKLQLRIEASIPNRPK